MAIADGGKVSLKHLVTMKPANEEVLGLIRQVEILKMAG